jgi:hypothetical protein
LHILLRAKPVPFLRVLSQGPVAIPSHILNDPSDFGLQLGKIRAPPLQFADAS